MVKFPLYDELLAACTDDAICKNTLKNKILNISNVLEEKYATRHHQHIIAIIIHHAKLNNEKKNPPYGIKVIPVGNGIRIDLDKFPPLLIKILDGYIRKYSTKI